MSESSVASRRLARTLALLLVCATAAGCAASPATSGPTPLPDAFSDGVPAPTEQVVLTVVTEDGDTDWDLSTLGLLAQQDLTIVEPFVDEEHTYTGPLWADVLRASGVDLDGGREARLVALDDYVAEIPTDVESLDGVLLASREDGEEIPIAAGGPIRLIWPPENPGAENNNNWIWSIRSARIE
jgi:hypothetical protein